MSRNSLNRILYIGLMLITFINFVWHIYSYRADIFRKFDSSYWTKRYNLSQWIVPGSKNSIGDDGLYIYAGYRYVQGDDPTLLNAEIPPLGKYIIGFFETITGYIGTFSLFFAATTLVLFYLFNKAILNSSLTAIIPVAVLSFDPLFISQIRAPYLDTLYLSFLILSFLLFSKKQYILSGITLGGFMAIKSPFLIFLIYAVVFMYTLFQKNINLRSLIKMMVSTFFVFLLSYIITFLHGHDLLYFLKVQKYLLHFYSSGAKAVAGAVFPMLFSGNWYTWFGPVQRVMEWTILWPIAGLGAILGAFFAFKKKQYLLIFQSFWVFFYLLFLIFTPIFARYLLLLLPFLYNLSIWNLSVVFGKKLSFV